MRKVAAWYEDFEPAPPIDNITLFLAMSATEGRLPADADIKIDQLYMGRSKAVIYRDPDYQIIRENDMIYDSLLAFLVADMAVYRNKDETIRLSRNRIFKQRKRQNILKSELPALEDIRNVAFDKFEMLRRLTAWDNKMLWRYKS